MKIFLLSTCLGALLCCSFTLLGTWRIGDDYHVKFDGRGASGTFEGLRGTVIFDPDRPAAGQLDVTVDVATIDTGNATKNRHATGEGWFDAARYPTIGFRSTAISATRSGYTATGELTLHGTTRPVSFPFTFTPRPDGGLFEGSFEVNRKDYGIEGSFGQFMVSSTLTVSLRVPVTE